MKRYPGPDPFSKEYKNVFFGREAETEELLNIIATNKLTVVFGRSGLGKSSLLNAAIIPVLEQKFRVVIPRFGSYDETAGQKKEKQLTLEKLFIRSINNESARYSFLHALETAANEESMWQSIKNLQKNGMEKKKGVVIVMDQFEEIFNNDEQEVKDFGIGLSEIVNNKIPALIQSKIYRKIQVLEKRRSDKKISKNEKGLLDNELNVLGKELSLINNEPQVKIIIGIRSDKVSKLENFSAFIPNILSNLFEIKQLTVQQARCAIELPASKEIQNDERPFDSEKFYYEKTAVDQIINYLTLQVDENENKVEGFQLQMICQQIEEMVINKEIIANENGKILVKATHLPSFDRIVKNYYKDFIFLKDENNRFVFEEVDRLFIRYLVEKKLINEKNTTRLSIDQALIKPVGISERELEKLINKRIIRIEPNTVRGYSYEISHDTMVKSLLGAYTEMGNLDDKLLIYFKSHVRPEKKLFSFRKQKMNEIERFVLKKLLNREGDPQTYEMAETDSLEEKSVMRELCKFRIINKYNDAGKQKIELYESFVKPAKVVNREFELRTTLNFRRYIKSFLILMGVGLLAIFLLILFAYNVSKESNKSTAYLLTTRADNIKDKNVALRVLEYAYDLHNDEVDIGEKIKNIYASGFFSKGPKGTSLKISFPQQKINRFGLSKSARYFFVSTTSFNKQTDSLNAIADSTALFPRSFALASPKWGNRFNSVKLFSINGDSIMRIDNVIRCEFLGKTDTLVLFRKYNNKVVLSLVSPSGKEFSNITMPFYEDVKGMLSPSPGDFNRITFEELAGRVACYYLPSQNKVVFQYYAVDYGARPANIVYFCYFFNVGDKNATRVYFKGKNQWGVYTDDNSIKVLWVINRKKSLSYNVYDFATNKNMQGKISLPGVSKNLSLDNSKSFLIGASGGSFFVVDLKKNKMYAPSQKGATHVLLVKDSMIITERASPVGFLSFSKDINILQTWKIENDKIKLIDSIVPKEASFFKIWNNYIFKIPTRVRYLDSQNLAPRVDIYNFNADSVTSVSIDSSFNAMRINIAFNNDKHFYLSAKNSTGMTIHVLARLQGKQCVKYDKFIVSGGSSFYDDYVYDYLYSVPGVELSADNRWLLLQTEDGNTLCIFDLNNKTSAYNLKGILNELKDPSKTLVPKLTPEQEKTYNLKRSRFWGYFNYKK